MTEPMNDALSKEEKLERIRDASNKVGRLRDYNHSAEYEQAYVDALTEIDDILDAPSTVNGEMVEIVRMENHTNGKQYYLFTGEKSFSAPCAVGGFIKCRMALTKIEEKEAE